MTDVINWLLEDSNPAVKYRTQTELLGLSADPSPVMSWIFEKLPKNWQETNGLWYCYYITALAECGLTREQISDGQINKAFTNFEAIFDCNCGDFMLLTALVKLGYSDHPVIQSIIEELQSKFLPDGGFLCLHRLNKLKYTPKSCYKANLHALLFITECQKKKIDISPLQPLIEYFLNRDIFFRSNDRNTLVLNCREGWRTIDTFYPFEVMRVGLPNVVEAFCALGYGNDERLREAWHLLDSQKDETGKVILRGTLTKSYLPKIGERRGNPSKWITFYTLLAEQEKCACTL